MLIPVKFEGQGQAQPMSAIFRAFDYYCRNLHQGDPGLLVEIRAAINEQLGQSGVQVLSNLMPGLGEVMGDYSPSSVYIDISNQEMYSMILFCLRSFVRAIAAHSHPVAILFDDLQYAAKESLDLIAKLVTDTGTKSCLFIGCYRNNEIDDTHPLLEVLGVITLSGVPMWNIVLDNLDKESVNELLSDVFHLSPRLTAPLADAIQVKTRGNPLFVRQLLKSLFDEGLLQYSANARRWQYNLERIRSKSIPDTAVGLVLEMMKNYGGDIQYVVQIAALLGMRFDAATLTLFQSGNSGNGDGSAILPFIDALLEDGFVVVEDAASSSYRFSHDALWEAALSLTDVSDRAKMHLQIGRQLLHGVTLLNNELGPHLFAIVDHLNRGVDLIVDHDERLVLAKLNLQAGEAAVAASSFLSASIYLLQGSVLLEEEDWLTNYDLCLRLFTMCAEVQLAHGNNDGAIISLNQVLSHGKCLQDKLQAYHVLGKKVLSCAMKIISAE